MDFRKTSLVMTMSLILVLEMSACTTLRLYGVSPSTWVVLELNAPMDGSLLLATMILRAILMDSVLTRGLMLLRLFSLSLFSNVPSLRLDFIFCNFSHFVVS
ncbi:unnamed protein product [Coffea canephora]|uniref:Uncharacterized protein n=1 Tax=Coffea canephora TaxID=49390 RepID=A0A068TMU4_COFCA|nr:unnamed protein product [Coffea canephora]